MTQYLDKAGLTRYDELIKLYIGDAMNTAVTEAIQELAGALKFKGLVGQNGDVTMHTAYPDAEKGDVYFVSPPKIQGLPTTVNITYYDGPGDLHDTEQMESGDALICLYGKKDVPTSGDASTYPRWGVLNVNWNAIDGSSTLSWGQTTTLATIGGVTIDAALPAKNSISPADIGAATAAQGALAVTAYQKPSGGIPKADLASAVQTSLGKADGAVQQADVIVYNSSDEEYQDGEGLTIDPPFSGNNTPISAGAVEHMVELLALRVRDLITEIEEKIPSNATSSNQLADKAFVAVNYKPKQTAATINPTASGTDISFITTISQDADGVVSATKQSVREASTSQSGLMTSELVTKLGNISAGADKTRITWDATNRQLKQSINGGTATSIVTFGAAAVKAVDTSIGYNPSENLPTSAAVASYVGNAGHWSGGNSRLSSNTDLTTTELDATVGRVYHVSYSLTTTISVTYMNPSDDVLTVAAKAGDVFVCVYPGSINGVPSWLHISGGFESISTNYIESLFATVGGSN